MVEWGCDMRLERDGHIGLFSCEELTDYLRFLIENRKTVAVMLMDLDFFYNIARRIGREESERVLERIGGMLGEEKALRAAHRGSDEFLLLAEGIDGEAACELARHYQRRLKEKEWIRLERYSRVPVKASFGVASCSRKLSTPFLLLKMAETALLTAKKGGRNRVERAPDEAPAPLRQGACHTLAGYSLRGCCTEGAAAFTAAIAEPYGVDVHPQYGLLFVDRSNHRIRYIRDGKIYTLAGNGRAGYTGDGGDPAQAELCKPSGVAVDPSTGRIYIADTGNHCLRMVEKEGISTIAGDGQEGYTGDGQEAVSARVCRPGGVTVDGAGNVYTNDYGNNVIRRISWGGIITTVAGNGEYGNVGDGGLAVQARLNKPYGLSVTRDGRWLYIADYGNHSIRRVNLASGVITTVCGTGEPGYSGDGGPARAARLNGPYWVALWRSSLLIADAGNHCIREVELCDGTIRTLVGNGTPGFVDAWRETGEARLNIPAGMTVDGDELMIADYGNNVIRRVKLGRAPCSLE